MGRIEELKARAEELRGDLECFELDPYDHEETYRDMIDELGDVVIFSMRYSRSEVLKQVDPTAYCCGLADYIDSIGKAEDQYQEILEDLEEIEAEIMDLEECEAE